MRSHLVVLTGTSSPYGTSTIFFSIYLCDNEGSAYRNFFFKAFLRCFEYFFNMGYCQRAIHFLFKTKTRCLLFKTLKTFNQPHTLILHKHKVYSSILLGSSSSRPSSSSIIGLVGGSFKLVSFRLVSLSLGLNDIRLNCASPRTPLIFSRVRVGGAVLVLGCSSISCIQIENNMRPWSYKKSDRKDAKWFLLLCKKCQKYRKRENFQVAALHYLPPCAALSCNLVKSLCEWFGRLNIVMINTQRGPNCV